MCVCAVAKVVVQIVRECFVFFFPLAKEKIRRKKKTITIAV